MACPKCSVSINCKDLVIVCEGACCKQFHAGCVGVPETIANCLLKNVLWLCDECLAVFYEQTSEQFKQSSPRGSPAILPSIEKNEPPKLDSDLAEELSTIKRNIANIQNELSAISEAQKQSFQCAPYHSTPISSPNSNEGVNSNIDHSANNRSSSSAASARNNDGTFSLFLTNIDVHVTEDEISSMVSRSLGVREVTAINVKKLVPKWRASETLDYISFKVRINDELKPIAFRADTWPAGITYREFIERPRNPWKPTV